MKIRDADGTVFDLPKNVATGLARSASNTFELVVDETEDADTPDQAPPAPDAPANELVVDETEDADTPDQAPPAPDAPAKVVDVASAETPSQTWTNPRIARWAQSKGIDLGAATRKNDMLAAIATALAAAATARDAVALDAALTPEGQTPVITDAAPDGTTELESDDQDAEEPAPADVAGVLAEDEDDTLEPDDPEPEDDDPASDGEG